MPDLGDFEAGARRVADQLIRDAMEEGLFDPHNNPGAFKPLPGAGADEPFDDNWWIRRWIQRENLQPPDMKAELSQLVRNHAKR